MNFTIISVCEATRNTYITGKSYEDKAIRLAKSIRALDKEVPVIMWYGEDKKPSIDTINALKYLECELVEGQCQYKDYPLFNKIEAMVTVPVTTPAKLWIDTDIYIRDGLDYFYSLDCDIATPSDVYKHHALTNLEEYPVWEQYYQLANITPIRRYSETSIDNGIGNFYLNTGIIFMKNNQDILDKYKIFSELVLKSNIKYSTNYYDAIGLTLDIQSNNKVTYQVIPEKYNYYYALHRDINGSFVHYQDNILDHYSEINW